MNTVDINCDMGESFGNYKCGLDSEIISYISSANIACGFHASDPLVMSESVKLAKKYGVSVGAHPGFPDAEAGPLIRKAHGDGFPAGALRPRSAERPAGI